MRLWSLFCEGNKTSDVPQLTNNYLCSKALKHRQQSLPLRIKKALHSVWRQSKDKIACRTGMAQKGEKRMKKMLLWRWLLPPSWKKESNQLCDRANLLINAHCYFSGIVCSNSQQRTLYFKLIKQKNVIGNMLKCLCRCSSLFFLSLLVIVLCHSCDTHRGNGNRLLSQHQMMGLEITLEAFCRILEKLDHVFWPKRAASKICIRRDRSALIFIFILEKLFRWIKTKTPHMLSK